MLRLLLPVLAHSFSLTLGEENQGRVRVDNFGTHVDALLIGSATLQLGLKRTDWSLSYSPSLTQSSIGEGRDSTTMFLNTGRLTGNLRLTRKTTMYFQETAMYGRQNLQVLASTRLAPNANPSTSNPGGTGTSQPGQSDTGQPPTVLPSTPGVVAATNTAIQFGSLSTALGISQVLDRRWSAAAFAGYTVSKQLGANVTVANTPQPYVFWPTTRSITVNAGVTHQLGSRDSVSLTGYSNTVSTEPSAQATILSGVVAWRHRFSLSTVGSLAIGEAYTDSIAQDGEHTRVILPFALAAAEHNRIFQKGRLSAFASVSTSPVVDSIYGTVYQALRSNIGAVWSKKQCGASVSGYGSSRIESYNQIALLAAYGASESVTCGLDRRRHWTVTVGAYQAWQNFAVGVQQSTFSAAYISLSYTTGAIAL